MEEEEGVVVEAVAVAGTPRRLARCCCWVKITFLLRFHKIYQTTRAQPIRRVVSHGRLQHARIALERNEGAVLCDPAISDKVQGNIIG